MDSRSRSLFLGVGIMLWVAPESWAWNPFQPIADAVRGAGEAVGRAADTVVDIGRGAVEGAGASLKGAGEIITAVGGDGAKALGSLLEKSGRVVQDVGEKSANFAASGVMKPSGAFVTSLASISEELGKGDIMSAANHALGSAAGVVLNSERSLERAAIDAGDVSVSMLPEPVEKGVRHVSGEAVKELEKKWPQGARLVRFFPITSHLYRYLSALARYEKPCDPQAIFSGLRSKPNSELNGAGRELGILTTLEAKGAGLSGWTATDCRATALGRVVQDAAYSTDNIVTVDLELLALSVGGQEQNVVGRYLRIEILPIGRAHDFAMFHSIRKGDGVLVSGPVFRDEDMQDISSLTFGDGWFEIHPVDDFEVLAVPAREEAPARQAGVAERFVQPSAHSATRFTYYEVKKGDTLPGIAEKFYGVRSPRVLILANRSRRLERRHLRLEPGWVLNVPILTSKGLAVTKVTAAGG